MSAREDLQGALEELEAEQEHPTFLYRNLYFPCCHRSLSTGLVMGVGPPVDDRRIILTVRKNALIPNTADRNVDDPDESDTGDNAIVPPTKGKTLTFQQRKWQVESRTEDPFGAAWTLECVSPHA